jgi:hypothetical protein
MLVFLMKPPYINLHHNSCIATHTQYLLFGTLVGKLNFGRVRISVTSQPPQRWKLSIVLHFSCGSIRTECFQTTLRDFRLSPRCKEYLRLVGYCAAYSGNSLPAFRNNLSVLSSRVMKDKKKAHIVCGVF